MADRPDRVEREPSEQEPALSDTSGSASLLKSRSYSDRVPIGTHRTGMLQRAFDQSEQDRT